MKRRSTQPSLLRGASIPSLVRKAHQGARWARLAEAVLIGVAASGLTLSASALSDADLSLPGPFILAISLGLLVTTTWLVGTHTSLAQTASALDQRLNQSGALLTAFEAQRAERDTEMTRLLAARVAARISVREALRVVRPLDPIPLAAPFIAAAILALALEAIAPAPDAAGLQEFAEEISGEIANARQLSLESLEYGRSAELGEQAGAMPGELTDLLAKVSELKSGWDQTAPDPDIALATINELRTEVEQTFRDLPPSSELSASIRALSNQLDAAAMRAGDASGAESSGNDPQAAEHSLALSGAGGRITSANTADGSSTASPVTFRDEVERSGAVAIRWRPEYDEIVARWVESRRSVEKQ